VAGAPTSGFDLVPSIRSCRLALYLQPPSASRMAGIASSPPTVTYARALPGAIPDVPIPVEPPKLTLVFHPAPDRPKRPTFGRADGDPADDTAVA